MELHNVRDAYINNASCIIHINILQNLQNDKGWYEKPTTYRYKLFDWSEEKIPNKKIYTSSYIPLWVIVVELKNRHFWFDLISQAYSSKEVPVIHHETTNVILFKKTSGIFWHGEQEQYHLRHKIRDAHFILKTRV